MSVIRNILICSFPLLFGVIGAADTPARSQAGPPAAESRFLAENDTAMNRMMSAMAVQPTGDIDRDFVAMMQPHHQGAIDMAQTLLRYGSNEQLKRLAQEIIVTQQQEIAAMRLAIGDPLPPGVPSPTQAAPADAGGQTTSPVGEMPMSHTHTK